MNDKSKKKVNPQMRLFPEPEPKIKYGLPDAPSVPGSFGISFCYRCGQPNPGLICPRCGTRKCPSCGDN